VSGRPAVATNNADISRLRAEMERIDDELVRTIARRCALARQLGEAKLERQLPVIDTAREAAVVRRAAEQARRAGIDDEPVRQVFWCLIELSRRSQADERARRSQPGSVS
jgi:chorismate mutase